MVSSRILLTGRNAQYYLLMLSQTNCQTFVAWSCLGYDWSTCDEIDRAVVTETDAYFDSIFGIHSFGGLLFFKVARADVSHVVFFKLLSLFL